MKKRLLLILAIGISFAPTVWAEGTGLPQFNTIENLEVESPTAPHCIAGELVKTKNYGEKTTTVARQGANDDTSSAPAL